jgi:oxygen-independent coproporphyrinogen-3 oxidase
VYWAGLPYFGFGPGAARYVGGRRETSHRSVTTWIRQVLAQGTAVADAETLEPEARARETLVLGLRRNAGVFRDVFAAQTGLDLDELAGDTLRKLIARGLLADDGMNIRLTREGRFLADAVTVELV